MRGVTKIVRLSWVGCFIVFCLVLSIEVVGQSGNFPCQPWGKVNYKGKPVPDGRKVTAYIQGVKYADAEVKAGGYTLSIPADDPSTPAKEGWEEGENISLKVDGYSGTAILTASSVNLKPQIDINLTTMGVLNLTTWGKIKALFK